ncbi:MAG: hypothetical protein JNL61_16380 [Rhizobiaceae bacterium]|nr:hypothetical protein [Rhizobiaceae bacterium]
MTRLTSKEVAHLQAMEGNPLTPEQIAMFEMFEREGWSDERRLAHIRTLLTKRVPIPAE